MKRELIDETRTKLDRAIELQRLRHLDLVKARRLRDTHDCSRSREQKEWLAELAMRRWTAAQKRVARAATFLRYLETKT